MIIADMRIYGDPEYWTIHVRFDTVDFDEALTQFKTMRAIFLIFGFKLFLEQMASYLREYQKENLLYWNDNDTVYESNPDQAVGFSKFLATHVKAHAKLTLKEPK